MKRFYLYTLLILTAVALATYWFFFPFVKDKELIQSAKKNAEERFKLSQEHASDPKYNGYLEPEFLPLWGRKDIEGKPDAEIHMVFDNWRVYSSQAEYETVKHGELQQSDDADYKRALTDFEKIEPTLTDAMSKPVFTVPDDHLSLENLVVNFVAVRNAALCLSAYAEAKSAQGEYKQALEAVVPTLTCGRNLMGSNTLIQDMIGIALQAIGVSALSSEFDPAQPIGADLSKEVTQKLIDAVPPKEQLLWSMEAEVYLATNAMEAIAAGKPMGGYEEDGSKLPGAMARENRIYQNIMSPILRDLREGKQNISLPRAVVKPDWTDYLAGRSGIMVAILVPNFTRADDQMLYNRRKMLGLATAFGLKTFREQKGRLPKSLEELAKAGIPTVEESELQTMTLEGAKLTVPLNFEPQISGLEISYTGDGWFEIDGDTILFHL